MVTNVNNLTLNVMRINKFIRVSLPITTIRGNPFAIQIYCIYSHSTLSAERQQSNNLPSLCRAHTLHAGPLSTFRASSHVSLKMLASGMSLSRHWLILPIEILAALRDPVSNYILKCLCSVCVAQKTRTPYTPYYDGVCRTGEYEHWTSFFT